MDEFKSEIQETNQEERIKLTDEQKAHIREEMSKCENPQDARMRRRDLARETGANIKQISAVAAYKVGPDGLDLRPQFPKSSKSQVAEVVPKIEAIYDNPTKKAWRNEIGKVIEEDFSKEELQTARVVCLPGQALQEVTDVYLPLGIQPQNIVCIERDPKVAATMRANATILKQPVSIFEGSVEDFLQSPHEPITIASFDFLGPLHQSFLIGLQFLRTTDKFMIITNFLQRRERKTEQLALSVSSSVHRTLIEEARSDQMIFGDPLKGDHILKKFDESVDDALKDQTNMALSEARDEGMTGTLSLCLKPELYVRPLDALYAEVGTRLPPGISDHAAFIYHTGVNVHAVFKSAFEKYPELSKKVAHMHLGDLGGYARTHMGFGKRGFVELLGPVMTICMIQRQTCDVRRYKYISESAGSPYQTDILMEYDMKNNLRKNHRAAYDFTRELFRVLGQYGKDAVSIQFEKFAKKLPSNYAGGTVAITVSLRVRGSTHARVSLNNLSHLIQYYGELQNGPFNKLPGELYARPRIEIKAE